MQMSALVDMENSGLIALLRDDKYEDLSRMYSLFRSVVVDWLSARRSAMSLY
jgi:cullin 3